MIEFAPFMLFLLGVNPDQPVRLYFARIEVVFSTSEACREAGATIAAQRTGQEAQTTQMRYEYRCIPVPGAEEVEEAWREFIGEGQ